MFRHVLVAANGSLLLFFSVILPSISWAKTFNVNSSQDVNDLEPGNGLCVSYLIVFPPYVFPFCTLRGAIEETNNLPGPDIISLPEGTFTFTIEGRDENNALTGDLDITDSLTIRGAGAGKTFIDATGLDRVFDILGTEPNVTISGVSIYNGSLTSEDDTQNDGAGIRNSASLSLQDSTITENAVLSGNAGRGGGIFNRGTCSLVNTTIEGNSAGIGGGVYNDQDANLAITSSTLNDNIAETGAGLANEGATKLTNSTVSRNHAQFSASSSGGGIYNSAELEILQSTVAGNVSSGGGGGLENLGVTTMTNTLLADNADDNCGTAAGIFSLGFNLEDGNTCGLNQDTDIVHTDPELYALRNNGGATRTHALRYGSPAIDGGKKSDSRGNSDRSERGKNPIVVVVRHRFL